MKLIINKVERFVLDNCESMKVGIFGISFKDNTRDSREAPSIYIAEKLLERDINVLLNAIQEIGAKVDRIDAHTVKINGSFIRDFNVDNEFIRKIRASYYLIGALLGWLAQLALFNLLQDLLPAQIPPGSLWPALAGMATGLVALAGFALPPLAALGRVPPLRVLRRDLLPVPASSSIRARKSSTMRPTRRATSTPSPSARAAASAFTAAACCPPCIKS